MPRPVLRIFFGLLTLTLLGACSELAELTAPPPEEEPEIEVTAAWDHRPEADAWTEAALQALDGHGAPLLFTVPNDIEAYCPAYPEASLAERKAFWVNMLSALAKHESTWKPRASGGGGRWHGLLQISPGTARGYGCKARSADALKDGEANLACAIRIMAVTVPRDRVISRGMRGIAADWGPFHQARKRQDMQAWTRAQPVCRTPT